MGLRFQNDVYMRLVHLPMLCAACGGVAQSKMLLSQLLSAKHNQFVSLVGSAPCSLLVPEVDMIDGTWQHADVSSSWPCVPFPQLELGSW
jgi:hypothetical protein